MHRSNRAGPAKQDYKHTSIYSDEIGAGITQGITVSAHLYIAQVADACTLQLAGPAAVSPYSREAPNWSNPCAA